MKVTTVSALTAGLLIGLACSPWVNLHVAQSQETKGTKPPAAPSEMDALQASAEAFESAFNKGNAAALAAQFTENAEVVDEDGNVVQGRDKIQARFAELFKANPKAKMAVELTTLRQLSPDIAVEDGFSATSLNPDEPGARSPYTLVHVKKNGKWLIASVRDFPADTAEPTAHDQLQPLAWLVGHWVDQSGDAKVETDCHWTEDGNYLIQEYVLKLRGGSESRGSQRIGWDPQRKTIRTWSFDQTGGFGESTWTPVDGTWIIKASGVTPDGRSASVTRTLSPLGPDLFQLNSTQRLVGEELLPDSSVRVARRPPAPAP